MVSKIRTILIALIGPIRATIMRFVRPKEGYFLAVRSLKPISTKFGFDRGKPIDRYYIEKFLDENKEVITGRTLEVVDDHYTKRFGGSKVQKRDIVDNNPQDRQTTIHGDLRNLHMIPDNSYDCLVITHTFGMIDDLNSAIAECYRILKPGGYLLATVSSLSPVWEKHSLWRFTVAACEYAFGRHFTKSLVVKSFGNVLAGQCFWVGMAMEELSKEELDYNDPHFPCIISIRGQKGRIY